MPCTSKAVVLKRPVSTDKLFFNAAYSGSLMFFAVKIQYDTFYSTRLFATLIRMKTAASSGKWESIWPGRASGTFFLAQKLNRRAVRNYFVPAKAINSIILDMTIKSIPNMWTNKLISPAENRAEPHLKDVPHLYVTNAAYQYPDYCDICFLLDSPPTGIAGEGKGPHSATVQVTRELFSVCIFAGCNRCKNQWTCFPQKYETLLAQSPRVDSCYILSWAADVTAYHPARLASGACKIGTMQACLKEKERCGAPRSASRSTKKQG